VRERFDGSDRLAQRARRILRNRSPDWAGEKSGALLDEADLAVVEQSENVTRAWSRSERRLVEASRSERHRKEAARIHVLAENLLRPLGHSRGPYNRAELEALWELASLPETDGQARVVFLRLALNQPGAVEQLANRLEPAVNAAVGLSQIRRRAVLEEVVLPALRGSDGDPWFHWVSTRVGIALGPHDEEFGMLASQALAAYVGSEPETISDEVLEMGPQLPTPAADRLADLIVDAVSKPSSWYQRARLTRGFVGVAPRLSGSGADQVVDRLLDAWGKDFRRFDKGLEEWFEALAPRLPVASAERIAEGLLDGVGKPGEHKPARWFPRSFALVAQHLPGPTVERIVERILGALGNASEWDRERLAGCLLSLSPLRPRPSAERDADRLLEALGKTGKAYARWKRHPYFPALVPWLSDSDVERAAERIVDGIVRALDSTRMHDDLTWLPYDLKAVAPRLSSLAAQRIADRLLEALAKSRIPIELQALVIPFEEMAPLPEIYGSRIAEHLLNNLDKMSDSKELRWLPSCLEDVKPHLTAPASELIADRLLEGMAKTDDLESLRCRSECLRVVGGLLSVPVARRSVARLHDEMDKQSDSDALSMLAIAISPIVLRLSTKEVERVADRFLDALVKTKDEGDQYRFAECLALVVEGLPPRVVARAAARLINLTVKASRPGERDQMAKYFAKVAPRLSLAATERIAGKLFQFFRTRTQPGEIQWFAECVKALSAKLSETAAERAIDILLDSILTRRDPGEGKHVAEAIGVMSARLTASATERAAARLFDALFDTNDRVQHSRLARAIEELAPRLPVPIAERFAEQLHRIIADSETASAVNTPIEHLASALVAIAGKLDVRTIFNLLKFPLYVGVYRNALRKALEDQTGRTFGGDVWGLVEQAGTLGLGPDDLSGPPARLSS
jgi:hypothetical protein